MVLDAGTRRDRSFQLVVTLCALCALCTLYGGDIQLGLSTGNKRATGECSLSNSKSWSFLCWKFQEKRRKREREREKGGRERKGGEGGGERICGSILGGGVSGEGAAFDPPSKCARNEGKQRPQMSIFRDSKWRRAFSSVANQLT